MGRDPTLTIAGAARTTGASPTSKTGRRASVKRSLPQSLHRANSASLIAQGREHYKGGSLADATRCFDHVLALEPSNPEAMSCRGLVALAVGDTQEAEKWLRRAVAAAPDYPAAHNNLGHVLLFDGRPHEALMPLRRCLELTPANASAWNNLGTAHLREESLTDAEAAYRRAIAIAPASGLYHANLALVFIRQRKLGEAEGYLRRALVLGYESADVHQGLGVTCRLQRQFEEACQHFERALTLTPRSGDLWADLGYTQQLAGHLTEAMTAYRRALSIDPMHSRASRNLAIALHESGDEAEAVLALQRYSNAHPGDASATFLLAALSGDKVQSPPHEYVVELFDSYAESFDRHLQELEYRVPEALGEMLARRLNHDGLRVVDVGCGTGLCGDVLRPRASHLAGIDMSPRMVDKARERGIYDELVVGDAVAWLPRLEAQADLIVAADVFIYVGALEPIFRACARALRPNGCFAFSIESCVGSGFVLRASGRYAHSGDYVKQVAHTSGLVLDEILPTRIRGGTPPIDGALVALRRIQP